MKTQILSDSEKRSILGGLGSFRLHKAFSYRINSMNAQFTNQTKD